MLTAEQQKLVEDNMALIYVAIKKMKNQLDFDFEEDFASGELGLCKAALKYNPDIGKFSTYAIPIITNEIIKNRKVTSIKTESLDNNKIREKIDAITIDAYEHEHAISSDIINTLIKRFPKYYIIILLLAQGKTYTEIAKITKTTRQNIDIKLSLMRKFLTDNGVKT